MAPLTQGKRDVKGVQRDGPPHGNTSQRMVVPPYHGSSEVV